MVDTLEYVVKKYKINIRRQHIIDIPDMNRDDMARVFAELNFNKGAEIGVERGFYSEVLCKTNPKLRLSCVDPWRASAYESGIHGVDAEQAPYEDRYQETLKRLAPHNCEIIRKMSMDAVGGFDDDSLDFVYIDGNHDFVNFTNDLHHWKKKVRTGGIVSGHDYADYSYRKFNHVKKVLLAYAKSYHIIPLFIVGGLAMDDGLKRDKFRSWFWVKDKQD